MQWVVAGWRVLRHVLASERVQRYRARLFQTYIVVALIAFVVLALLASQTPYFSFDLEATQELQSETAFWVLPLMRLISWPGFALQSIGVVALSGLLLVMIRLRWEAAVSVAAALASGLLNTLIKLVIRRPRPDETLVEVFDKLGTYSFPSGHVMFYVSFFGFLLFLSFTLTRRPLWRWLSVALLLALVVGVGPSRMYLGDHWASDVLGGYILGSIILWLAVRLYLWGRQRMDRSTLAEQDERSTNGGDA